ncbi:MAG: YigZ family protein, partial [Clostridia bacterium]
GNSLKFGDDGEPQGTAGQPMLEVLKKKNIRMTLAVVTRYFGGIKLGAGGLVSAYSAAIAEALSKANILSQQWSQVVEIQCCYEHFDCVKKVIESQFGLIDNVDYGDCIILRVAIKIDKLESFVKDIDDCTLGKTLVKKCVEQYCSFLNDK